MARLRFNNQGGTITDNPLTAGATTFNSAALASLPVVTGPDYAIVIFEPNTANEEIVQVSAHTAAATSATIVRAQETTTAISHVLGSVWIHGPTVVDFVGDTISGVADSYLSTNVALLNSIQTFSAVKTFTSNPVFNANAILDASINSLRVSALTGTTLPATIVNSSLTGVGILAAPHMTAPVVDSGGLVVTANGLTVTAGGLTVSAGGASIESVVKIGAASNAVLDATADRLVMSGSLATVPVSSNGAYIGWANSGFGAAAAGDLVIVPRTSLSSATRFYAGNGTPTQIVAINATGLTVSTGGLTVSTGGLTVNAGGAAITGTVTGTAFSGPLTGAVTGNATTATTLQTARAINGVNFDGSAAITITAAAGTLTGATLAAGVTASSLTGVGTLAALTVTATITGSVSGNAGSATVLQTARAINGVNFDGSAAITIAAAAGTLTGATLAAGVTASSLTSVGTLTGLTISGSETISGSLGTGAPGTTVGVASLFLSDTQNGVGAGGALLMGGQASKFFAAIKGYEQDGTTNTIGDMVFYTRRAIADATLTETMRLTLAGLLQTTGSITMSTAAATPVLTFSNNVALNTITSTGAGFQYNVQTTGLDYTWQSAVNAIATLKGTGNFGLGLTAPTYGLHQLGGGQRLQALVTPSPPTVTPTGVTGSTTYNYYIVAKDRNGNTTLAGFAGTTSTGNATLTSGNYNALSWTAVPGAVSYDILRNSLTTSIALGVTATVFNDIGYGLGVYVMPLHNSTADYTLDGNLNISALGTNIVGGNVGIGIIPTTGLHQLGGGQHLQAVANPGAPTVTPTGVTGNTVYSYYIVAKDRQGGTTLPSSIGTTGTGNATLTASNYNAITWTAVPGAVTYDVLKTDQQHSIATGVTTNSFNDVGGSSSAYGNITRNTTADSAIDGQLTVTAGVTVLSNGVTVTGNSTITGTLGGITTLTATTFSGALSGNATTASTLQTPRAINGVNFDGSAAITVAAAAGTLTGSTLASGVTASSLTSVGILASTHLTSPVVDSGGLTVTAGGLTVTGTGNTATAFSLTDTGTSGPNIKLISSGANPNKTLRVNPTTGNFEVIDTGYANILTSLTDTGVQTILGGLTITGGGSTVTGPTALTGALASRRVGAWSGTGSPTGITGIARDFGIDGNYAVWICSAAGSPGTWGTLPLGKLGYAVATANQGSITTEVDVTSCSVTVTVGAGRRIRVSGYSMTQSTVASDLIRIQIKESTTILQITDAVAPSASNNVGMSTSVVLTPSAGSHTYKLTIQRIVGTGTVTITAGATVPTYILVEDIGV